MATAEIVAAVESIHAKKDDLRRVFDAVSSFSSSLASFTLKWKDLEDHFALIEKSIADRLKELEYKSTMAGLDPPEEKVDAVAGLVPPVAKVDSLAGSELRSLCAAMDAKGLRLYVVENRKDLAAITNELDVAIGSAPNPAKLVLDAMDGFYDSKSEGKKDGEVQVIRRTCLTLLERLQILSTEIEPLVRDEAKKLALEWKGKASNRGENQVEVLSFLQLLVSFKLVSEFKVDEVFNLFVSVCRKKQAVNIFRGLGLVENMPDFVQKMQSKGKQLDAVKFIHSLNLLDKYPPVPLLKNYLKVTRKAAQEVRKKGINSRQSQNEAIAKEITALRAVINTIKEYKLESQYSSENLQKRITQLEQEKTNKCRTATGNSVASNSSSQNLQQQSKKRPMRTATVASVASHLSPRNLQQQQANKRLRPSTTLTPTAAPDIPPPIVGNKALFGLTNQSPYMGLIGSYGLASTRTIYDHAASSQSGLPLGVHGNLSPRRHLYTSEPFVDSHLYNSSGRYVNYSLPGMTARYPPSYP
ncbi:truncated FRIGIDA-like protein 1 [Typha latifolia]|uniref:truncated FRIGIDA-like protein 1 n=1 Tax=Typha latifolia TaxID=4733 RepID=UPI003C2DD1BA